MEPQTPPSFEPKLGQQQPPLASTKNHTKRNLIIIGVAVLIVAAIGVLITLRPFNGRTNNNAASKAQASIPAASKPKAMVEQVLTNPADSSKITINQTDYYSLTVGGTTYYGPLLKINDAYLRLTPTAYKSQGQLIFTGGELHGPEPATFFAVASISDVHKLSESSPDDAAIINFVRPGVSQSSYAYPSDKIDSYLKTSQLQAFFFKDGTILFAKTSSLEGDFLSGAKHVYYIANTDGQVSLTVAKPELYASRTGNQLLYWQNLKWDGRVAKAILQFEKNNP